MEAIRKIQGARETSDEFRRLWEDVDRLRDENRQLQERIEKWRQFGQSNTKDPPGLKRVQLSA